MHVRYKMKVINQLASFIESEFVYFYTPLHYIEHHIIIIIGVTNDFPGRRIMFETMQM